MPNLRTLFPKKIRSWVGGNPCHAGSSRHSLSTRRSFTRRLVARRRKPRACGAKEERLVFLPDSGGGHRRLSTSARSSVRQGMARHFWTFLGVERSPRRLLNALVRQLPDGFAAGYLRLRRLLPSSQLLRSVFAAPSQAWRAFGSSWADPPLAATGTRPAFARLRLGRQDARRPDSQDGCATMPAFSTRKEKEQNKGVRDLWGGSKNDVSESSCGCLLS